MRQELYSDIEPKVKTALQRRKNRIINRKPYEYSKTAFIKVWPVALVELATSDEDIKSLPDTSPTYERTTAAAERYVLGMQAGGVRDPLSSYKNKYNRPKSGITGLSAQFEGYSGKGLVKMQLKGIINTLEDLDIYKPVLFTPGNYWVFEWGYIPDKDTVENGGDGFIHNVISTDIITDLYAASRIGDIFEAAEEHRKTTKGTAEIQVAVVNNYEYTLNAAGSFEFTVDFTGNSTLFRNNISAAAGSGFKRENVTFTDANGNAITKEAFEKIEADAAAANTTPIANSIPYDVTKFNELTATVTETVRVAAGVDAMNLDVVESFKAATPSDFFKNLKKYIIECYKSSGTDTTADLGGAYDINRLNPSAFIPIEDRGRSEMNVRKHGMYYEGEKVPIIQAKETFDYGPFNNELGPYVTWGWFEDNILNVVYGKNKDTAKPIKWESVDQDGVPLPLNSHKYLYTTTPNRLIIPGRMPEMLETPWQADKVHINRTMGDVQLSKTWMQRGTGDYSEYGGGEKGQKPMRQESDTHTANMLVNNIYGAYHPIVYDYISISQSALGFDEALSYQQPNYEASNTAGGLFAAEAAALKSSEQLKDLYDKREALIETEPGLRGSIRRLLLHYRLIQDSFQNAASPIEGLKILLHKIEGMGYRGFWEFDIFEVDNKIGVYEKNSLTGLSQRVLNKVKEQIKQNKIDSKMQENETPPAGEVFVFPSWNKDGGFVLNQNLRITMPSTTMLAMVYANSKEGSRALKNAHFGNTDEAQTISAISAGKKKPQKVTVEPGFQGSAIVVIKSIELDGSSVISHIPQKYIHGKTDQAKFEANNDEVEFIFIGDRRTIIDDPNKKEGEGRTIFERGASLDAHGMMYDNIKQIMNHRLSKSWIKEGGEFIDITSKTTRNLSMAELSIKISGLSGLNWGNQFHTDYIEENFKKEVVFFISKVNHEINEGNWTTEIVGQMRGVFNEDYIKEKASLTTAEDRYISIQLTEADNRLISKMSNTKIQRTVLINNGRFDRVAKDPKLRMGY